MYLIHKLTINISDRDDELFKKGELWIFEEGKENGGVFNFDNEYLTVIDRTVHVIIPKSQV